MTEQTPVGHCRDDDVDYYIGRGHQGASLGDVPVGVNGWLGNPYTLSDHEREESISKFKQDLEEAITDPLIRQKIAELHGQTLGCWCRRVDESEPACHGDVIAEKADEIASERKTL